MLDLQKTLLPFKSGSLWSRSSSLKARSMKLKQEISTLLKQTGSFITTIPGIGDTLGAIILSEIGGIHRFDAPGKLVAFAGLDV